VAKSNFSAMERGGEGALSVVKRNQSTTSKGGEKI